MENVAATLETSSSTGFRDARLALDLTRKELCIILRVNERTLIRWEDGQKEPHPSAAKMMSMMLDGYRPNSWPHQWTGDTMRGFRDGMGWSQDDLADALGLDVETVALYEAGNGPPEFVAELMTWLGDL
jgi:DNA-binding transcriptional regulator YiaG